MAGFIDVVRSVVNSTVARLSTQDTLLPVRAGVLGATGRVATSYARGLLPRSPSDQALATGVASAVNYLLIATTSAASETIALYASGDRTVRARKAPQGALLVSNLGFVATGLAIEKALPAHPDESLAEGIVRFAGYYTMIGGASSIAVQATDEVLRRLPGTRNWRNRSLFVDAGVGLALAGVAAWTRRRRAKRYGMVDPDRPTISAGKSTTAVAKAVGMGAAAGAGLLTVAKAEQVVARQVSRLFSGHVGRLEVGSPWLGHLVAMSAFGAAGTFALSKFKARTERRGDVLEAAYPDPPAQPTVTAGPTSTIAFDDIGKEGRRFVLMALTPEEITAVMGAPAMAPIRVVGGYESAPDTPQRAKVCLEEMEALGAFDRSLICVASPTGVGYVSYVFAETLEYLTLGDCAIVVPQYALVPSALALNDTKDGAELQRLVLEGIAARIAAMPAELRPTVVQFGESLGAQVALDVAFPHGADEFERLGVSAGLYLGVPFRTKTWNLWHEDKDAFDPDGLMMAVSQPATAAGRTASERERMRHLMVVHHDDPVNKFSYRAVVTPPWWLGPAEDRPPKVPRETLWRPLVTFVLTLVDLKNGMQFAPGNFRRVGHDYRIDTLDAVELAYNLTCTPEQHTAIEDALRRREVIWAERRLVARKFKAARDSITRTLNKWGVSAEDLDSMPSMDSMPNLDAVFNANAAEVLDSTVGAHAPLDDQGNTAAQPLG